MTKLVYKLGVMMGAVLLVSACQDGEPSLSSQSPDIADRGASDFSEEDLEAILEMMETAIDDGRITAAIAMLARNGEMTWLGTAGEMEPGTPMRDDAILPLASVGKMFTATAAMILYERGVLSLDDPVSKYIPEFAEVMVGVTNEDGTSHLVALETPITVHHLLTHTGGLTVTGNAPGTPIPGLRPRPISLERSPNYRSSRNPARSSSMARPVPRMKYWPPSSKSPAAKPSRSS